MLRILLYATLVLVHATPSIAKDPNNLLMYKKHIISGLQTEAFNRLDLMYDQRFSDQTVSPGATINKTPVYYDAVKALWNFYELCHDRSGLSPSEIALVDQIPSYIVKAKKILAQRYIQNPAGGGGYQAFPHGLAHYYRHTGDIESWKALSDLRNEGSWTTGQNPSREHINYSRESAYTLQIGVTSLKLGLPFTTKMNHSELIEYYLGLAKSHMDQWHTGNFYYNAGQQTFDYRASFMAGLTTTALIEYYERVNHDPSIPPKIKNVIDDLWTQMWHADVTNPTPTSLGDASSYYGMAPEGAFWVWADWISDHYDLDENHYPSSQDVAFTHNSIIGAGFAWYASYSNDSSYISKAEKIFNGIAHNMSLYNPGGQLWEGMRYVHEFIKYYRRYHNTPCADATIEQCTTKSACENIGGDWSGEWCQHAEVIIVSGSPSTRTPENLRIFQNP